MLPLVSTHEPEADRHALGAEVRDRLLLAILEDTEVFFAQARDESAVDVGHRGRHVDQLDAGSEAEDLRTLSLLPRWALRPRPARRTSAATSAGCRAIMMFPVRGRDALAPDWPSSRRPSIDVADHVAILVAEPDAISRDRCRHRHVDDEPRLVPGRSTVKSSGARPLARNVPSGPKSNAVAMTFESTAPSRGILHETGDRQRAGCLRLLERQKLEEARRSVPMPSVDSAAGNIWRRRSRPQTRATANGQRCTAMSGDDGKPAGPGRTRSRPDEEIAPCGGDVRPSDSSKSGLRGSTVESRLERSEPDAPIGRRPSLVRSCDAGVGSPALVSHAA